jgi:alpha-galactosidase
MQLKFGLFSAAGISSCTSGAGSLTYEQVDAQDFAQWGVDYLKYGDCNGLGIPQLTRYMAMAQALNSTGRPVFLSAAKGILSSLSQIGWNVSNSLRTSSKVLEDPWQNVKASFLLNNNHAKNTRPGWLNDPDLLAVGLK